MELGIGSTDWFAQIFTTKTQRETEVAAGATAAF
jgi:hypothetical protein